MGRQGGLFVNPGFVALFLVLTGAGAEPSIHGGRDLCPAPKDLHPGSSILPASHDCPAVGIIQGRSRLLNLHRVFHVANITVQAPPGVTATACLHQNMSAERGACQPPLVSTVGPLVKSKDGSGAWSGKYSPFEFGILEVTTTSPVDTLLAVSITEVFEPQRVAYALAGFLLFYTAPAASKSLILYYGSFMGLGVLIVTLVLLFQLMKLMPFGERKTAKFIFSGFVLGLGSVVKQNAMRFAWRLLHVFGVGEPGDPLLQLVVIFFAVAGAGLGFWFLRKFVLNDRGRPDDATQKFVEWGCLRLPALVLLLQASYDYVFIMLFLAAALLPVLPLWNRERLFFGKLRRSPSPSDSPVSIHVPPPSFSPWAQPVGLHYNNGEPSAPNSAEKRFFNSISESTVRRRLFPSAFHTPDKDKRPLSTEEYDNLGRKTTAQELAKLYKSPEFKDWVKKNSQPASERTWIEWASDLLF